MRVRRFGVTLLCILLLPVAGCAQQPGADDPPLGGTAGSRLAQEPPAAGAAVADPRSIDASRQNAIAQAARRVAPAVVSVLTLRTERVVPRSFFDSFLYGPDARRRASGLGSGFVIDPSGVVLTNEHVVRGADRIMVTLPDGRDLEAELVGSDAVTDLAVLRARGEGLPVAPLGSSDGLIIGEWAVAIGNPFANFFSNSEPSVTAGVISAVGRHIVPTSDEQGFYLGMIQTDASINPGNSGGPLVNALGQVIGVNSSIFSRGGGSEGLGFAIPIDRALRVAEDLLAHGEVRRAWPGFDVEPVQADVWGRTRGVRVSRVVAGSPAERAGVRPGVRVLEAAGRSLRAPLDFEDVLLDLRAGDEIALSLEGAGSPLRLRAEALPTVSAERVTALEDLELISVTPAVRAEQGVASEAGAMIVAISPELSARLGFQRGDVLVSINNVPIRSAADAVGVFRELRGRSGRLRIIFERNGSYLVRDLLWQG
jgi:serine protease Do